MVHGHSPRTSHRELAGGEAPVPDARSLTCGHQGARAPNILWPLRPASQRSTRADQAVLGDDGASLGAAQECGGRGNFLGADVATDRRQCRGKAAAPGVAQRQRISLAPQHRPGRHGLRKTLSSALMLCRFGLRRWPPKARAAEMGLRDTGRHGAANSRPNGSLGRRAKSAWAQGHGLPCVSARTCAQSSVSLSPSKRRGDFVASGRGLGNPSRSRV